MTLNSIVFLAFFITANVYFLVKFRTLLMLAKATNGPLWNPKPLNHLSQRVITTIANVLGQKAVLQRKAAGIMHATIFWGFIVITVETTENFIRELVPSFSLEFLGPTLFSSILFVQDTFTLAVLLAVSFAFYRRLVIKPEGLGKSRDAIIVLTLTGSLMISLLAMRSFRMIAHPEWYDSFAWVSKIVSVMIEGMALSPEAADVVSVVFRWVHHVLVLGFLMYIPNSKHLHILAAGPNTFLKNIGTAKGMRPINLEDEKATSFGAGKYTDLSWKDTVDLYSCTECGRCQDACPAHNTGKPLSPKRLILDLKDGLYENKAALLAGKVDEVKPILNNKITDDVIWACTSCRACESACPVFIEQTNKIYEVRRNMVLMESRFPAELAVVFKNLENNFSPWAMSPDDRDKWTQEPTDLQVKTMSQLAASGEKADVLFWVGCAGSFDDRNKKVSRALVNILKQAGIKFAILGKEEKCTGDPARRMGNEYLAQTLIKENVALMNNYGVTKVVTACPHCFNAIKNEWKDFDGNYEVIHHTQLIASLIAEGKIKPQKGVGEKVTYHDSCYIGRWNNEYSAPRSILQSMPSTEFKEIKQNSANAMCCGAGGGRMWMEETIGVRVNVKRTEQALETGATVIAANCPFCMTMLSDGVKSKDAGETVRVMDLAEIVEQSLKA